MTDTCRDWQPIETAPRDGTRLIVTFLNSKGEPRITCVRWKDTYWRAGSTIDGYEIFVRTPVRWMLAPLPYSEDPSAKD